MLKCGKSKKNKNVINFTKRESILKTCVDCRKKITKTMKIIGNKIKR